MSKIIKTHLDQITVDALLDFRGSAFMVMAGSTGNNGHIELGVNAVGQFVVKARNNAFTFNNPAIAIEKYASLLQPAPPTGA